MTTSTVNPNVPAQSSALSSLVVRSNFGAAANDINNLYALIAAGGGGGGGSSGILTVVPKTSNYVLLTSNSGNVFTNTGSSTTIILSLPISFVGLTYTAFVSAAHPLEFLATGTDIIANGNLLGAAAGNIQASTVGSCVQLACISLGTWSTITIVGDWTLT